MNIRFIIPLIITCLIPLGARAQVIDVDAQSKKKAVGVTVVSQKIEAPLQTRTYEDKTNKEESEKSRALFHKANRQFESRDLAASLFNYKKAYKTWDHPRILFNMGVALAMLGRPLEAANMFKAVLEYGPEPVGPLRYKEAKEKWLELMGSLSILRIKCSQDKVKVFIDGDSIATCPANKAVTINSGRHLITASRTGYIAENANVYIPRGVVAEKIITLRKFEQAVRYQKVNRIPLKWTIIGASAAALLLAGGGYAIYKGRSDIDSIQDELNTTISTSGGFSFAYDDTREKSAVLYQNLGTGIVGVGIGAAITAVLLYVFKDKQVPVTYTVDDEKDTQKASE
ncbi:hypothetical protein KKF84_04630 [Myxococcota bacterium]|nr:hypothetical protein [Myxococcota bacterium]